MKLSNEQYDKLINLLVSNGYKNDEVPADNFRHYIENKHPQRFLDLISFLKSNKIEVTCKSIAISYKLDVVIRRKLAEVLKPIELGIVASLSHYLQFNGIHTIGSIGVDLLDDMSSFENNLVQKRIKTQNFVLKTLNSINRNNNCNKQLQKIICKLTFGQVVAFLEILKEDILKEIFPNMKEKFGENVHFKGKIIKLFEEVIYLRNHIAHHNMILTNNKLVNFKRKIILSNLIESLSDIALGNYKNTFKADLDRYLRNSINKNCKDSDDNIIEQREVLYKNIFAGAYNKIFSVSDAEFWPLCV